MIKKLKDLRNGSSEEGFTLIELMIVVVIIGVLAAIAIPIFSEQQRSANDAALKSDMRTVSLAQSTYMTKNPSSSGTNDRTEMQKLVPNFTLSDQTVVATWVEKGKGYCVVGYTKHGTIIGGGGATAKYSWYDSALGGLQLNATTGTPPAGGVCGLNPRPEALWHYGAKSTADGSASPTPGWQIAPAGTY
jgi:type IV pilus assembly protein PilA